MVALATRPEFFTLSTYLELLCRLSFAFFFLASNINPWSLLRPTFIMTIDLTIDRFSIFEPFKADKGTVSFIRTACQRLLDGASTGNEIWPGEKRDTLR